jgi:hypothetical protein
MSRRKVNAPKVAKPFCEGLDKNAGGEPCRYYQFRINQCTALKEDRKRDMFEYGRCLESLLQLIDRELEIIIRANPSHYAINEREKNPDDLIVHRDSEDVRYDTVVADLRATKRKFDTLSDWHWYLGRAARNAVTQCVYRRGLAVPEHTCKYCKHRSSVSPYKCSLVRYVDNNSGEMIENSHAGLSTESSDEACEGFEHNIAHLDREADAAEIFEARRIRDANPESAFGTEQLYHTCTELLIKRAERATSDLVKKMRHREYILFVAIAELIRKGFNEEEATTELLKEIPHGNRRQALKKKINRSRAEINRYLRENLPSELYEDLINRHHRDERGR